MPPSTRGRLLAVCCLVLGLALVTVAVGGLVTSTALGSPVGDAEATAAPPQPVDDLQLPGRMDLDGQVTDGGAVVGVDVGGAIDRDSARLASAYERSRLDQRLQRADNASEREAILADAYAEADATFGQLRARERAAFQSYQVGRIDADELLAELRTVHVRAEAESSMLSLVVARSDSINETYGDRASVLDSRYVARQGTLRAELAAIAAGQATPRRYYVASGADGVMLSRVGPDGYAREIVRDDLLVLDREPRLAWADVPEHVQELYPTFAANNNFGQQNELSAHVVQIGGDHDDGRLEFYVDRYSQDVFREYQTLDLDDDLPTRSAGDVSSGPLGLQVNRTYPSGPGVVTVTEAGAPVSGAPIFVDGTEVATTDEDGRAWVVLPYGEPDVTTSLDDRELSVHVDWTSDDGSETSPVNGSDGGGDTSL